jgi:adenosine deaminase CECR1
MRRKYAGVHLSIHGGEVDAPGREVRNTLLLGAERVGHAVNLITDPDTMLLMRNGRNLVEVSLVSNRLLEYVPSFAHHPFPEYLRFGIPVCLNTDDPGVWDSNLTDEYFIAVRNFDLAWEEVVRIGRASIEHSFTPAALKAELLRNYDSAVKAFESRYADAGWQSRLESVKPSISGYARRNLLARE